jgi:type IV pilus assembly protein PilZ
MARPGGLGLRKNMLQLHIPDEQALYNSYLPFLKHGGLFLPITPAEKIKNYKLGDEVFVLFTLLNDPDKMPVAGKVVWINPQGVQGRRPAGIGVHFGEMDKGATRTKIEKALGALIKSDKGTYTM